MTNLADLLRAAAEKAATAKAFIRLELVPEGVSIRGRVKTGGRILQQERILLWSEIMRANLDLFVVNIEYIDASLLKASRLEAAA